MGSFPFRFSSAMCLVGLLAVVTGCQGKQDKLAYDNFIRIQQHLSTQAEVVQVLGEPSHVLGTRWMYERPDKHLFALIDFDGAGRVTQKQWVDAPAAVWEDSHETGAAPKP